MSFRTYKVIVLSFGTLPIFFGSGCDNTTNDGGVNATKSIVDTSGPKSQEEYARQQLANSAAAKKAARSKR